MYLGQVCEILSDKMFKHNITTSLKKQLANYFIAFRYPDAGEFWKQAATTGELSCEGETFKLNKN